MSNTLPFTINNGIPRPLGVSVIKDGFNFSIVSTKAKAIHLCLFSPDNPHKPLYEIPLDPQSNRTGYVWHIGLHQLPPGLLYLYRVDDLSTLLLDPYAKEVHTTNVWLCGGPEKKPYHPMGVVEPPSYFEWEKDRFPKLPLEDLVIYEMHVRGFTKHPSSGVSHPGTFLGVIEKIPHLLDLGINAVELLPIHEFNEHEYTHIDPLTKAPLCNFWGYSTVNFFSPMQRYASRGSIGAATTEFKQMVKELHKNGIEVILDVVFNHTAEGGINGPVLTFKGIDNALYYMLDGKGAYRDFTGCGNTVNCAHPIPMELILESLRYWVTEMHVDGFRFDLASIFMRDAEGQPMESSPIVNAISQDPLLAHTKLIAEPWDAVGLYQVGSFPHGERWSEWNGRYRDTIRRFIKGTGYKGDFSTNLCGSQDLYFKNWPCRSVNFITAHDGFTLSDLVTYSKKHNLDNGENNRDGTDHNESWNSGIEGPSTDKKIVQLRERQMRNFHLALMISRGIPMLLMGDEYAHTKRGNNNTWCQDNELNWFLWDQLQANADFYRFYKQLVQFRHQHPDLSKNAFYTTKDICWHGLEPFHVQWDKNDHFIACSLYDLYIAFNANHVGVTVQLPQIQNQYLWHWVVNTANPSPDDFQETYRADAMMASEYQMLPHSAIMLQMIKRG